MFNKYIDQLADLKHKESIWKLVTAGLSLILIFQAIAISIMSYQLVTNIDRVRYILSPGIQTLTTVRPGKLSEDYIEQSFLHVVEKLNAWSYESIKENYRVLFDDFYTLDLKTRTQANLKSQNYFDDVEKRKLVSLWSPTITDSEFHWCGNVQARKEIKGVACGIVTGKRKLFADHNIPISEENISYLIYAVNVAPTPTNFFAVQVTRLKRGPLSVLKAELESSLKDGVLPSEDSAHENP